MRSSRLVNCISFVICLTFLQSHGLSIDRKPTINDHPATNEKPQVYFDVTAIETNQVKNGSTSPKLRHNLPECATQQVCNALFVRMNHTQHLCECPSNYNWECSADPNSVDGHTIELTRRYDKKIYTQVKLCEPLVSVRNCKAPTDWTLLALQSERSGKAHYVVVCRCPDSAQLEGPYTHSHPPYARVPGIRVYGMLCVQGARRGKINVHITRNEDKQVDYPEFPWDHAYAVLNSTVFQGVW